MWQRKQTIYLITLLFVTAIILWSDVECIATNAVRGAVLTAIDGITALVSIGTIVIYSQRRTQMRLCRLMQLLQIAWLAYFCFDHFYVHGGAVRYPLYALMPVVSFVLAGMAYAGVKHDDNLVKSADRIR